MFLRFANNILRFFSPAVMAFAFVLIGLPWIPVFAQRQIGVTQDDRDIGEINRRLNQYDQLQLDRRLTVLETNQQESKDNALWYKLTSGGTGLLILEAALRRMNKPKEEESK